jgi:hypothetical protein
MQTKTLAIGLALIFSVAGADLRTMTIQDPRPLAKAIESLENLYGVPITYEDPPYVNAGEIADVTAQVRGGQTGGRRILIPRGGSLSFAYEAIEPPLVKDATPVVEAIRHAASDAISGLLANYQTSTGSASFALIQGPGSLHVVPTQFLDQTGQVESLKPILDTSVSLPAEPRTAAKLVGDLRAALTRTTGQTVILGTIPYGLLARHKISLSISDAPARSVLDQLFAEIDAPLSWQLFHDPGLNWYVLNIHLVQ